MTAATLTTLAASLRAQAEALTVQAATLEALAQQPAPPVASLPPSRPPYLTLRQLAAQYPAFPLATLRHWVSQRGVNGLHRAVVELGTKGGKLLIDDAAFLAWVGRHKAVPPRLTSVRRSAV